MNPTQEPNSTDCAEDALANRGNDAGDVEAADTEAASDAQPAEPEGQPGDQAHPTILVIHASVGSGHKSAANAIEKAFELLRDDAQEAETWSVGVPHDLQIEVMDILDYGRIKFNGDSAASMFTGVTRPFYDLTWRYTFTGRFLWGGGTVWARLMFPKFVEAIRRIKPIAIVCTHITGANVAVSARMITRQRFPIVCVPTDYEVEGLWPHLYTDMFCVANEQMAETLRARKIPESRIKITGIPPSPNFRFPLDKEAAREHFGLPEDKQVVLALAGATLPRPYVHFRSVIDDLIPYFHTYRNMHMVIVAGKDEEYADKVRRACKDHGLDNVTILEYVENMAELMSACDLVLCKPGGLVVTECLCMGLPMVLTCRAYGQEKANVRMLTSAGAALHVTTARELIDVLHTINDHPQTTDALLINASLMRKPNAALQIAKITLQLADHYEEKVSQQILRRHFVHFYFGHKPAHPR